MCVLTRIIASLGNSLCKTAGILVLTGLFTGIYAQTQQDDLVLGYFDGNISLTNNGISYIPALSLGQPAAIANLSVGGKRFSFDPQFRFDLNGLKPWGFLFRWRYKLIDTKKIHLKIGAHFPAITFIGETVRVNGSGEDQLVPVRFLVPELMPAYSISENIRVGVYYLYGFELEKEHPVGDFQYLSFRFYFDQIRLGKNFNLKWIPQVYYLTLNKSDGIYMAQTLEMAFKQFPVRIGTKMNVKIQSDIPTKDFEWNISLIYFFSKQLVLK